MLDHLSLSWGSDETLDLYEYASDVTLQWSTIEQSNPEGQPDGPHNDGVIFGPDSPRVHPPRAVRPPSSAVPGDERRPGGADQQRDLRLPGRIRPPQPGFRRVPHRRQHVHPRAEPHRVHAAVLRRRGPGRHDVLAVPERHPGPRAVRGVVDDISGTPLADAAFAGAGPDQIISSPSDFSATSGGYVPVTMQAPADAAAAVLDRAGAFPRDAMTAATVDDVRNGTGSWEPNPPDDLLDGLSPTEPPPTMTPTAWPTLGARERLGPEQRYRPRRRDVVGLHRHRGVRQRARRADRRVT